MTGAIAILGWGSLLWDLDDLEPKVEGPWILRSGPRLPMEFSRVSPKRLMGLVLALDPSDGVPCPTHAIRSRRELVADAVADLAARERAPSNRIGWADAAGSGFSRLPEVLRTVSSWCAASGWTAAVWTDLEPNFHLVAGAEFSVPAGLAYLRTLRGPHLVEAHRYIRSAPLATRTPLRRALARDAWWRGLGRARPIAAPRLASTPGNADL